MNADHRELIDLAFALLVGFVAGALAMRRHITKQKHAATVGGLRERAP